MMKSINRFTTSSGRTIYAFPILAFPSLVANIYIISDGDLLVMVDCGSGLEKSNKDLVAGLEAIAENFGLKIKLSDIDAILITHGHIDHFGGLPFMRRQTTAPIGIHPLDRRVLTHYEERVMVASRQLETFLRRAGVASARLIDLMSMYLFAKGIYLSTPVQFTLDEGDGAIDDIGLFGVRAFHVPGHCPGQICLQVDDILLTADHVLSHTTPHQSPESITNNMGLGHYLDSLTKIERLDGIELALGGHEKPIADLVGRIKEIKMVHEDRLERILDIAREPKSIETISRELFGRVSGYHVLLALEEAGAHVEYLYQYGELVATNLEEIEKDNEPVIYYRRC